MQSKRTRNRTVLTTFLTCLLAGAACAQTLFEEGFESYTTSNPTNWTRSGPTLMLVVTNNATDLGRTHKVAEGLRSFFIRDGENRTLTLNVAAAVPVTGDSEVVVSFRLSQNVAENYESADHVLFSVAFGAGSFFEVLKDAAKLDGGGTATTPLVYSGARIDLPTAVGKTTVFAAYAVKLQVPVGATSMRMRFLTYGSSGNEDVWLDSIAVVKRPRGTVVAVR